MVMAEDILKKADRFRRIKEERAELKKTDDKLKREAEEIELEIIGEMTEAELQNFSVSGKTFYLTSRLFASPKAGEAEKLYNWLKVHGYGDIVKETVNANTLSAFIKELKEEHGDELPADLEDILNVFEKVSIGMKNSPK